MILRRIVCGLTVALLVGLGATEPTAQNPQGYCGFIWPNGGYGGGYVTGWSTVWVPWCFPEGPPPYGVQTSASVGVYTPWGTFNGDGRESNDIYVESPITWAPLNEGESGQGAVTAYGWFCYTESGEGGAHPFCEDYYDWVPVVVDPPPPPPPPPPPSLSLTASPPTIVAGNTATLTAVASNFGGEGGEPIGSYTWQLVDDPLDPGDDPSIAQLVSAPSCAQQAQCDAQLQGNLAGIVTAVVTLQSGFVSYSAQTKVVVQPPPYIVRLVLYASSSFDLANPPASLTDDAPAFVPGSTTTSGAMQSGPSVPISTISGEHGQVVEVVGFLATPANPDVPVSPPAGAQLEVALENTSAWRGFATNAGWGTGRDNEPDYDLSMSDQGAGTQTVTTGFSGNFARVYLHVRDYGGRTVVKATMQNATPGEMPLPRDTNNNWLPDLPWSARYEIPFDPAEPIIAFEIVPVATTALSWSTDDDDQPAGSGAPDMARTGDGLTAFEEYRGFKTNEIHQRMSPQHKDLFVTSSISRVDLTREDVFEFARRSLWKRGNTFRRMRLHYLKDETQEAVIHEYDHASLYITSGTLMASGATIQSPGAGISKGQRLVRIIAQEVENTLDGDNLGATGPNSLCSVAQKGLVPLLVGSSVVDVDEIVNFSGADDTEKNNDIKRVAGHELGHAVHVKHINATTPAACDDDFNEFGTSMMTTIRGESGQPYDDERSQYTNQDIAQMRLWVPIK